MSDNYRLINQISISFHVSAMLNLLNVRYGIELFRTQPRAFKLLVCLWVVDFLFIAVFVGYGIWFVFNEQPVKYPQIWSLSADYSASEFFGYLNMAGTVTLLCMAFFKTREPMLLSWAGIFTILILDDVLQLHEFGGEWIASILPIKEFAGVGIHHFGELVVWMVLGLISFSGLMFGLIKSNGRVDQYNGFFLLAISGLVFCGLGIDLVASFEFLQNTQTSGFWSHIIYGFFLIAEDGGELVFMSLSFAGAYAIWKQLAR